MEPTLQVSFRNDNLETDVDRNKVYPNNLLVQDQALWWYPRK